MRVPLGFQTLVIEHLAWVIDLTCTLEHLLPVQQVGDLPRVVSGLIIVQVAFVVGQTQLLILASGAVIALVTEKLGVISVQVGGVLEGVVRPSSSTFDAGVVLITH